MKTKIGKQYYLIPIIYILIIVVLLHFQYSTDESFVRTIRNITVNGERSKAAITGKRGLSSLNVDAFGFTFSFDDSNPVLIETKDGLTHKFYALDFTPYSDGIEINLGKGMSVRFLLDEEGLRILPDATMIESIERIKIPVTLQPGIEVRSGSGMPVLAVTDDLLGETYFVALQEGIQYQEEEGYFILDTGQYGFKELVFRSAPPGIEDPLTFWFAGKANFPDSAEYNKAVGSFLGIAKNGWENSRFSRETGTWDNGRGSEVFSEKIAVILLSEAVGTGRFSTVHENMTIASAEHRDELTRLSSPFLGDIINLVNRYVRADNPERLYRTFLESARKGDTKLFSREGLIRTVELSSDQDLRDAALKTIQQAEMEEVSILSSLGMIDYLLSIQPDSYIDLARTIIDTRIVPSLTVIDEGVYISTGDRENLEILSSIRTGSLLLRAGKLAENETYEALGRSLIAASLSLADEDGFLPEIIRSDGLSIRGRNGVLPPEEVYLLLADNRYYPQERPLTRFFGDGSWMWSGAREVTVTPGSDMYSISFTYPRGETHYIAIHGLAPFSRMKLLGIDWKGDPIFQYYYSGWYYDQSTSTLYIKLRHRTERETIEIYYSRPVPAEEPQAAVEEPVEEGEN